VQQELSEPQWAAEQVGQAQQEQEEASQAVGPVPKAAALLEQWTA
jgi:hypothetical protein